MDKYSVSRRGILCTDAARMLVFSDSADSQDVIGPGQRQLRSLEGI